MEIAIVLDWDWQIAGILDQIEADLTTLKEGGDRVDATNTSKLAAALTRLPEAYEVTRARIRALM